MLNFCKYSRNRRITLIQSKTSIILSVVDKRVLLAGLNEPNSCHKSQSGLSDVKISFSRNSFLLISFSSFISNKINKYIKVINKKS